MDQLNENEKGWWKKAVFYHIVVASFYDFNNDGYGDLKGVLHKLDYIKNLGINAIWLSPVFCSPMFDLGYDVSNYYDIDSKFGSIDDLKQLISEAHKNDIKLILDLVMNHTSLDHPWFLESSSSKNNPKRNWYIWKKGSSLLKPNNWKSAAGGSAWCYDVSTGEYYYHSFFKEQPDLNWRNVSVQEELFKVVRFWLDMGIDGFRLDVINFIVKDKKFRNSPPLWLQLFGWENFKSRNRPKSYKIIRKLRKITDEYENKLLLGEVYTLPPGRPKLVASYLESESSGLHMAFDFSLIFRKWNARRYYRAIYDWMNCIPENSWPCHVLSNHDLNRSLLHSWHRNHRDDQAKILAMLMLTLKGTPFIYYGDEIGMQNFRIPRKKLVDPLGKRFWPFYAGRDRSRTPMQWNTERNAGFTKGEPWLPVNSDCLYRNAEIQKSCKDSVYTFYEALIKLRLSMEVLHSGTWSVHTKGRHGILAYWRTLKDDHLLITLNFSIQPRRIIINSTSNLEVILSTHRPEKENLLSSPFFLFPHEASIFRVK